MKKIIMLLSSMFLLAAFAACGDDSKKKTPADPGTVATTVYMVGDSTMCSFTDAYYYPRYGYGTQLSTCMNSNVTINNLAVSGIGSKTFLSHANYTTLTSNIKSGDYLVIGFGHNDEGVLSADGDVSDSTSFQYYIYNYYVKLAIEKGATPILCTPVVRRDPNGLYEIGSKNIHYMGASSGDYVAAIKKVASTYSVTCIDLTTLTRDLHLSLGVGSEGTPATASPWTPSVLPSGTMAMEAWLKNAVASIDNTHTNIFGAKYNAYLFANALLSTSCSLKNYVLSTIAAPVLASDLVTNSSFVLPTYKVPTVKSTIWTTTDPWWGSVFGACGTVDTTNYAITETSGVSMRSGANSTTASGKLGTQEGIAFYFQKIPVNTNFTLSATATVTYLYQDGKKQTAFGLMVCDGVLIDTTDNTFLSASVAVGSAYVDSATAPTTGWTSWMRDSNGKLSSNATVSSISVIPVAGTVVNLSITKAGSVYTCTYGSEVSKSYTIDLVALDSEYIYPGLFTARCCQIEWSNIKLQTN
jgi:hypothetical protein